MARGLKVGQLYAELRLDKKKFDSGLSLSGRALRGLGKIAKVAAVALVAAFAIATGAAVKFAVDFEKGMANVHTLIGQGSESDIRIAQLGDEVKRMSVDTGKSLDDLTGGLYQVVSAFGDTADTAGILEVAAKASSAGLATTEDAVNLLSAVTKGYGDTSVEAVKKASDLAFQTVKLGQTTFPELAAAIGKVVPQANALGISQEELFASAATLTGVTGSTSEVMTQMQGIMTALLKPNTDLKKAFQDLGYEGVNAGKDLLADRGLQGALEAIASSSTAGEKGLAKLLGKAPALTASLALTGSQADVYAQKLAAMADATGETNRAFETQQATVGATFDRVKAAVGVLLVNLGEKLLPVLQDVLDWIIGNWDEIAAVFDNVFNAVGEAISWFVSNIIPPLVEAFTFVVENVIPPIVDAFSNTVPGAVDVLGDVFDWVANTILPAVAEAFTWISENVIPVFQAVIAAIVSWFQENWPLISDLLDSMATAFGAAFNYASTIIGAVWPGIVAVAEVLFPIIGQAAQVLLKALTFVFDAIGAVFESITPIAKAVVDAVVAVFKALVGPVKAAWDGVTSVIKGAINFVIGLVNGFIGFVNSIQIHVPEIGIGPVHTPRFDWGGLNLPTIPYLKAGVKGFSGGLAVVGEAGPELVNLPRGSDVIPNRMLSDRDQRDGGKMKPEIIQLVVDGRVLAEVVNRRNYYRGGSTSRLPTR